MSQQGDQDDISLSFTVGDSMSVHQTFIYRLEMPLVGLYEEILVFNGRFVSWLYDGCVPRVLCVTALPSLTVAANGMTSWSHWLDCWCNMATGKTERIRFRVCMMSYKQFGHFYCPPFHTETETEECDHDLCEGRPLNCYAL